MSIPRPISALKRSPQPPKAKVSTYDVITEILAGAVSLLVSGAFLMLCLSVIHHSVRVVPALGFWTSTMILVAISTLSLPYWKARKNA